MTSDKFKLLSTMLKSLEIFFSSSSQVECLKKALGVLTIPEFDNYLLEMRSPMASIVF